MKIDLHDSTGYLSEGSFTMSAKSVKVMSAIKTGLKVWNAPVKRLLSDCFQVQVRFGVQKSEKSKLAEWSVRDSKGKPQVLPYARNDKGERVYGESEAMSWLESALDDENARYAAVAYLFSALSRGSANADACYHRSVVVNAIIESYPIPADMVFWADPNPDAPLDKVDMPDMLWLISDSVKTNSHAASRKARKQSVTVTETQVSDTRPEKIRDAKISVEDIFSL